MFSREKLDPRREPQQSRSRETVGVILEATLQFMRKSGDAVPSMQAIADRAGVSIGSIYQYFPNRNALVGALLRFYLQQRLGLLEAELKAASCVSATDVATMLIRSFVEGMASRSQVELSMLRIFSRAGDLAALTQVDDRMNAVVETFIRSLGSNVRPANPEIAAFLICNTLRSAVLLAILQKPEWLRSEEFQAELTRMIVSYLRPID